MNGLGWAAPAWPASRGAANDSCQDVRAGPQSRGEDWSRVRACAEAATPAAAQRYVAARVAEQVRVLEAPAGSRRPGASRSRAGCDAQRAWIALAAVTVVVVRPRRAGDARAGTGGSGVHAAACMPCSSRPGWSPAVGLEAGDVRERSSAASKSSSRRGSRHGQMIEFQRGWADREEYLSPTGRGRRRARLVVIQGGGA